MLLVTTGEIIFGWLGSLFLLAGKPLFVFRSHFGRRARGGVGGAAPVGLMVGFLSVFGQRIRRIALNSWHELRTSVR